MLRKINSNGKAPTLHAGSTGIDTRILQEQDFCINGNNFLVFSFFLVLLFSSFFSSKNASSVSRLPAQNHCITITLHYTRTTTKVLVVHSLFQTAKYNRAVITTLECLMTLVMERKTFYELSLPHSLRK